MNKAIGMVEYKTVSAGITAADTMVKTSDIEIVSASAICPGHYYVLVTGDLSAIDAAIDTVRVQLGDQLIDSFVLGNPADDIFTAMYGGSPVENAKALGILETFSMPSIIVAADTAAKTSDVTLIELRLARGMCGKSYMLITGDVAAVSAAIEHAKSVVGDEGMFLDSSVIANPDKSIWDSIL